MPRTVLIKSRHRIIKNMRKHQFEWKDFEESLSLENIFFCQHINFRTAIIRGGGNWWTRGGKVGRIASTGRRLKAGKICKKMISF
jgi:hypothetical protein